MDDVYKIEPIDTLKRITNVFALYNQESKSMKYSVLAKADLSVKAAPAAAVDKYTYPIDAAFMKDYAGLKAQIAKEFNDIYVADRLDMLSNQLSNGPTKENAVLAAESISCVFPSKKVYDLYMEQTCNVYENGGKIGDIMIEPKFWSQMSTDDLFNSIQSIVETLKAMFDANPDPFSDVTSNQDLYENAAVGLILSRALFQKLDETSLPEQPTV